MLNLIVSLSNKIRKPKVQEPVIWQMEADSELMELVDAAQAIATADLMDWCMKVDRSGYTSKERIQYGRQASMMRQWGQTVLY